jgi:DnaJ-class molecular chaperone
MKQIQYTRQILKDNARTTDAEKVEMSIEVKPGFSDKTELKFAKEGNQVAGCQHSDLLVKFE